MTYYYLAGSPRRHQVKRVAAFVLLILSICFFSGCRDKSVIQETTVNNIVGVYWHEGSFYSFAVEDDEGVITMQHFRRECPEWVDGVGWKYGNEVRIIRDVPKENKMWAKAVTIKGSSRCNGFRNLEIHIHDIQDINGAGWNHGKFGSGTTTVISH